MNAHPIPNFNDNNEKIIFIEETLRIPTLKKNRYSIFMFQSQQEIHFPLLNKHNNQTLRTFMPPQVHHKQSASFLMRTIEITATGLTMFTSTAHQ